MTYTIGIGIDSTQNQLFIIGNDDLVENKWAWIVVIKKTSLYCIDYMQR